MLRARTTNDDLPADATLFPVPSAAEQIGDWLAADGPWWMCSAVFHALLLCVLALVGVKVAPKIVGQDLNFGEVAVEADCDVPPTTEVVDVEVDDVVTPWDGDADIDVTILTPNPDAPLDTPERAGEDETVGDPMPGGPAGVANSLHVLSTALMDAKGPGRGPRVYGKPGTNLFDRPGDRYDPDFRHRVGRPTGQRPTKAQDRAVIASLNWLARHQLPDGSWSLGHFHRRCNDTTCTGPGTAESDVAATSLGLLPFLGTGQTHLSSTKYRSNLYSGMFWLMRQQKPDGDLRGGSSMYAHALAAITLCEDYGLSRDKSIGLAAQRAINFIQAAQHPRTGGWRYNPGDEGDISVTGWQIMALTSAQMARLSVDPLVLQRAKAFLRSACSSGQGSTVGGLYAYLPGGSPTTSMTAVGLLCNQYLGAARNDQGMVEGTALLMKNPPEGSPRDLYYLYYATQVMHNQPGPEWDDWNRKMRRVLVETQNKEGCAAGSWDPQQPTPDRWGSQGGRLMMTSLAALTLEVYYRYLPLYKLDTGTVDWERPN